MNLTLTQKETREIVVKSSVMGIPPPKFVVPVELSFYLS